jgi:hypothetical protein
MLFVMEGRFSILEPPAHQKQFKHKNVTLPALKAVGNCETDKGR